jgi:ATP-dependent DNA ligase
MRRSKISAAVHESQVMQFGVEPQLARASAPLPLGAGWCYERRFDGFRAIVFVDSDAHRIQSRGAKDLTRHFPQLRPPPGATCSTARS